MGDDDTEKYHPSRVGDTRFGIFESEMGCIRCISMQVYNKCPK